MGNFTSASLHGLPKLHKRLSARPSHQITVHPTVGQISIDDDPNTALQMCQGDSNMSRSPSREAR